MILQIIGAFIAIFGFAILLEIPKKYLVLAGTVAAIGWSIYLFSEKMGTGAVFASFFSALTVTLVSHLFARMMKTPVTIFPIAGIIPTVPGAGMYRIAYYMIMGDSEMYSHYFTETLKIAGVIALAIFIMDTIFKFFMKNGIKQNSLSYTKRKMNKRK